MTIFGHAAIAGNLFTKIVPKVIAKNVAQEWTEAKAMTNAEKFLAKILPELIPYELKCNLHTLRCPGEVCDGECLDCFYRSINWLQEEVEGESE